LRFGDLLRVKAEKKVVKNALLELSKNGKEIAKSIFDEICDE